MVDVVQRKYISILFEQMLVEMPVVNAGLTKELVGQFADNLRNQISSNHSNSEHLGGNTYRISLPGKHVYYNMVNNRPREISYIEGNKQRMIDKGDGDVSVIHGFVQKHIDDFGEIFSDNHQSKGGQHFWRSLIDKFGENYKFDVIDSNGNQESINSKNYAQLLPKIYSKDPDNYGESYRLRMSR